MGLHRPTHESDCLRHDNVCHSSASKALGKNYEEIMIYAPRLFTVDNAPACMEEERMHVGL